jgi:NTP pyrophosphatase (non-canonical NTP hydrolase)
MNANDYQKAALRTERTPDFLVKGHQLARLLHGAIGMCTESGELQDAIKKHLIYDKPLDNVNVVEEIGDLLWYCALVLDAVGSNFGDAFARNIAKLAKRYPDKFTSELALNRDLDAERKALEGPDERTRSFQWPCSKCGQLAGVTEHALVFGQRAHVCPACREL